jgi:hypothetical protein
VSEPGASRAGAPGRDPAPAIRPPGRDPAPAIRPPGRDPVPAIRPPGGDPAPAIRPPGGDPAQAIKPGRDPSLRNALLATAGVLALLVAVVALAAARPPGSGASVLSRGPEGWLAARRYLEARGAHVDLLSVPLDRWLEEGPRRGVLVVSFPWQTAPPADLSEQLDLFLQRRGDLVLAYPAGELGLAEERLLDLDWQEVRSPPLAPWKRSAFRREEWELRPADRPAGRSEGKALPLRVWAPRFLPVLPRGVEALFVAPSGKPAVAIQRRHRGRVALLPADVFANSRLGQAGNADLLEALLQRFGRRWTFDEYHHGFAAASAPAGAAAGPVVDLLLAHLAVLYLLAILALARRQGPAWSEPPVVTGSAGAFLLGLGALHHRLGHHREAAARLLRRVHDLDRGLELPAGYERLAADAGPAELVELARGVARRRRGRPPGGTGERR